MYSCVRAPVRAIGFACLTGFFSLLTTFPSYAQERPFSWTGFYVGGHGAYNWSDIEFPGAPAHPAGPPRQQLSGALLGGQIGYNYQISGIVAGIEADISKGNLTGTVRDGNYITQTDTIDLTATLRARLGVVMGSFLPYITAGIMWDRGERGQQCPDPAAVPFGHCSPAAKGGPFAPYNLSQQQWHSGFVWGGGVEYAVGRNMSLKVEALFAKMGDEIYVLSPAANGAIANISKIEHDTTTVRFGVNYRFN
jgi:outer membrane immunogenic protein